MRNSWATQNSALWTRVVHFPLSCSDTDALVFMSLWLWMCVGAHARGIIPPSASPALGLQVCDRTSFLRWVLCVSQDFMLAEWALHQLSHPPALDFLKIYKPKLLLLWTCVLQISCVLRGIWGDPGPCPLILESVQLMFLPLPCRFEVLVLGDSDHSGWHHICH